MVDVAGAVDIGFGDGHGRLVAHGRVLDLQLEEGVGLGDALGIGALRLLADQLSRFGLTLNVRRGDQMLLRAGSGAKPGVLGLLLRLPHTELNARFALRSAFARRGGR
jgi:hypothetical protein